MSCNGNNIKSSKGRNYLNIIFPLTENPWSLYQLSFKKWTRPFLIYKVSLVLLKINGNFSITIKINIKSIKMYLKFKIFHTNLCIDKVKYNIQRHYPVQLIILLQLHSSDRPIICITIQNFASRAGMVPQRSLYSLGLKTHSEEAGILQSPQGIRKLVFFRRGRSRARRFGSTCGDICKECHMTLHM